jgi:hypothetical protein
MCLASLGWDNRRSSDLAGLGAFSCLLDVPGISEPADITMTEPSHWSYALGTDLPGLSQGRWAGTA